MRIITKIGYDARYHWLKERALTGYKTYNWDEAVTTFAKLCYGTREPSSTEQQKNQTKVCKHTEGHIYVIITWAERKILEEKTKWIVRVLKVFMIA